ncbi:MAG: hypothetical protein IPJ74_09755 [Saprospiraceae bacterium]|nr:hypothetical protein [Saprospiraceae bacterium]
MKNTFRNISFVILLFILQMIISQCKSGTNSAQEIKEYLCRGNEPFWMVEIKAAEIIFRTPEEEMVYTRSNPIKESNAIIFETRNRNPNDKTSVLKVKIFPRLCTDSMSGEVFPYTAEVERDEIFYEGCAR